MKEKRMTKRERKALFGYGVMSPMDTVTYDHLGTRVVKSVSAVLSRGRMRHPRKVWPESRLWQDYHVNKLARERSEAV